MRWLTPEQPGESAIAIGNPAAAIIAPRNPDRSHLVVEEMIEGIRRLVELPLR